MGFSFEAVGQRFTATHRYSWKEVALYHLGCGATADELDLLLESRGPKVLPSYASIIAGPAVLSAVEALGGELMSMVHGAQACLSHRPLPPEAELHTELVIEGLWDKGKHALATLHATSADAQGVVYCETDWELLYRGQGGFGGPRGAPREEAEVLGAPDLCLQTPTQPTQALLYRLSGDLNPIHADPQLAQLFGFERPILHGLASFGFCTRAAATALAGGDTDRIERISARFSQPVLPGETLEHRFWREGERAARFESQASAAGPCLRLGRVQLRA